MTETDTFYEEYSVDVLKTDLHDKRPEFLIINLLFMKL